MSNQEKIVAMNDGDVKVTEVKKENFLTKTWGKVKSANWKKIGLTALKVAEGATLLAGGFILGSKYGKQQAGLIPGEGTVEETEEQASDDFEPEEEAAG